jgi:hypothetical protein
MKRLLWGPVCLVAIVMGVVLALAVMIVHALASVLRLAGSLLHAVGSLMIRHATRPALDWFGSAPP